MTTINVNISGASSSPLVGELIAGELKTSASEGGIIMQDVAATDETNTPAYFKFGLRQRVRLIESGERGSIIARSEDAEAASQYRVRYRAADGRQQECWWSEEAIAAI